MTVEEIFNKLLAEEYQQWYSYFQAAQFIVGPKNIECRQILSILADDELHDHARHLMIRMFDLGINNNLVIPNLWFEATPDKCTFNYDNLEQFVIASINSEKNAIASYDEALNFFNETSGMDTTTINMLEDIKKDEEEHLHQLNLLLNEIQFSK